MTGPSSVPAPTEQGIASLLILFAAGFVGTASILAGGWLLARRLRA